MTTALTNSIDETARPDAMTAQSGASNGDVSDYIALLKPRVMSLVVFTALVGMVVAHTDVHPVIADRLAPERIEPCREMAVRAEGLDERHRRSDGRQGGGRRDGRGGRDGRRGCHGAARLARLA